MIQILPFTMGGGLYGLSLTDIQEVVDDAPIHYLPGAPVGILGAINLHGRILPVVDLPAQFGHDVGPRAERMIVLSNAKSALVLAVDTVRSVLNVEAALAEVCRPVADQEGVAGLLDWKGETIRMLSLEVLWEDIRHLCEMSGG
ncbi:MAG: hypothetical protein C0618_10150 [Desulfuromonas sp.]|nr:MAG: hypothetical protein C0618_10150 [Desulfuromonas sp.]